MIPVLTGLAGVLVTAAVTAYLGRRSTSGRITTSPATELWTSMRSELDRLTDDNAALRAAQVVTAAEVAALRAETADLRQRHADADEQLKACAVKIVSLEKALLREKRKPRP